MRAALWVTFVVGTTTGLTSSARAQHDPLFDNAAADQPVSGGAQAELDKLDRGAGDEEDNAWDGPRLEVGYEYFDLSDGHGGGATHMAMFGGFLPIVPQLRAGLSLMGGIRDYAYEDNDLFFGARAIVGYQYTDWNGVLPYLGGTLMGGAVIGERFTSSVAFGLIGLGVEAGLDVRLVNSFYAGFGLGYTRADMAGLAHDLLIVRLRIGL